jgi:hypothetical protein
MARAEELTVEQYATFKTSFVWKTKSTNEAVDLSSYTGALQIRRTPADAVALVSLTSGNGIDIEGPLGRVNIEIAASVTSTLSPGRYVYDLVLTSGDEKKRLVEGSIIVDPGVTR